MSDRHPGNIGQTAIDPGIIKLEAARSILDEVSEELEQVKRTVGANASNARTELGSTTETRSENRRHPVAPELKVA